MLLGAQAAGLDVAAVAQPAKLALGRRRRLARREAGHVGDLDGLVQVRSVVAGVVGQAYGSGVGELGNEVLPAEQGRVDLHLSRRGFDDALDHVGGFGPAGAAVGIHRRGVGEHRLDLGVDGRRLVLPGQQRCIQDGRHARREGRQVGPHVGNGVHAQGQEIALRVHRQFGRGGMVAAMRVGQEGLAALGRPLDRPADALAGPDQRRLFGIEEDLRAEAAADVGRDDAHLRFGQAEHEGTHQQPLDVRVLVGHVQRVALVVPRVLRIRRARLHRVGDQPVVGELQRGDMRRLGEGRVHRVLVAVAPVVADVVRHVVVDCRAVVSAAVMSITGASSS